MVRKLGKIPDLQEEEVITEEVSAPRKLERSTKFNEDISDIRSVLSAAPKGALKELRTGLDQAKELTHKVPYFGPKLKEMEQQIGENPLWISPEKFSEKIEETLPTKDRFLEAGLERGGRNIPYVFGGGLPAILRGVLGGVVGQGIEEMGGSPLAQTAGEIATQGIPALSRRIQGRNPAQEQLLNYLRQRGLSEEQIAPLIQGQRKTGILGRAAYKRGAAQRRLGEGREGLNILFDALEAHPDAGRTLTGVQSSNLLNEIQHYLANIPAADRAVLSQDLNDLIQTQFRGSDLLNFRRDINRAFGRGRENVGPLLEIMDRYISNLSPSLAEGLNITNQSYRNFLNLQRRLQPGQFEDLMKLGRKGRLIAGLALHAPWLLAETIGEAAAKKLSTEMLTNPRFQNLSIKMINALNNGRYAVAKKLADQFMKDFEDEEEK